MEEFLAQYGLLIFLGLLVLYLLTKGRRHLAEFESKAKDAALDALLKKMGGTKAEKVEKIAEVVEVVKKANPKALAKSAISVLENKLDEMPERTIPDEVDETDDIDGLGAALNDAIKAETKREKIKSGLKTAGKIGLAILKGVV